MKEVKMPISHALNGMQTCALSIHDKKGLMIRNPCKVNTMVSDISSTLKTLGPWTATPAPQQNEQSSLHAKIFKNHAIFCKTAQWVRNVKKGTKMSFSFATATE